MKEINSKSSLAVALSGLKGFEKQKVREEQYLTPSEIAADMLWIMHMRGELDDKTIADLGSGTGMLGLGALLLGAKKAFLVDKDKGAMDIAKQNYAGLKESFDIEGEAVFVLSDVSEFDEKVDVVVENPPFGTKEKHADRAFLGKAFSISDTVWSFHKSSTNAFAEAFSKDRGFKITEAIKYSFPIPAAHEFHTRKLHRIDVTLYRFAK